MKRPIPVLIALAMAAVAQPHGASAESIAVFTKNTTNPFSKAIRTGADAAGKKLSIDVSHYVPTSPDNVAEQTKLVDDAIAKKPDLIVFDPVDNENHLSFEKPATNKGVEDSLFKVELPADVKIVSPPTSQPEE